MRDDIERLLKLVPSMKERFTGAASRYRSLSENAKSAVVRWEWCTSERYSHRPFGPERGYPVKRGREYTCARGRVLKKEPEKKNGKYRYGLASNGRVLMEEHYTEFEEQNYEAFWEHSEARIDTTLFNYSPEKWVISVETTFVEDGVARGFVRYATRGLSVESYEYRDGVLVCVHQAQREHDPQSPKHALNFVDEHLSYHDGHLVKIIRKWLAGGSETVEIHS